MVKRSTWVVLLILALVVGVFIIINGNPLEAAKSTPTASENGFLVNQSDGVLQSLSIFDRKGHNFQMQRDLSKTWVITAPTSGVADQALADAAETQVGALRFVTMLETPPVSSDLGLVFPGNTLEMKFVSGTNHTIEVGNLTPTGSGYYVRYDGAKIYVISPSGINALLNMLTAPPYPATKTSSAASGTTNTPITESALPTP
jgi:hypothetical protein